MSAGSARYLHIIGPKMSDGVVAKVMARRPDDARLIAAAPELFGAASRLLAAYDARTTVAEQIVTGRSERDLREEAQQALVDLRAALAKATGAA